MQIEDKNNGYLWRCVIGTLAGVILGDLLGVLLGVKSNVGGVGIAMILLICARLYMQKRGGMSEGCEMGVGFWGAMYIPVVVAMAAQQNVVTALKGGPIAVIAAIGSVVICACTIAVISRTNKGEPLPREDEPVEQASAIAPTVSPAGGR